MINSFEREIRESKLRVDNVLKSCSSTTYVKNAIYDHFDTHDCNFKPMNITSILKHLGVPPTGKTFDIAKILLTNKLGHQKKK